MVSVTLSVPQNLKNQMDLFPEINWSAIAREAIKGRIEEMKLFKEFVKNSTLTEKDAVKLGRDLKRKATK